MQIVPLAKLKIVIPAMYIQTHLFSMLHFFTPESIKNS